MFRKIITYFLILAVVLPVLAGAVPLPAGGGVNVAQAADATEFTSSDGEVYDPCGWTLGVGHKGGIPECTSYKIVNFLYDWVLGTTIWIAGFAGNLFNASIQFSLTGKVFDASENGNTMIKDGWTLVRDLLNLIFIFILLFASISTILQYGGFEIKKVLPSLIVVALLVNFSMMIAKMVIDASHIFAWEFYNQIDVKNEEGLGEGKMFANIKNDINVYGEFEKKNLANVFIAGFNPQELLTGKEAKEGEEDSSANKSLWKQAVEKKIDEGESISDVWWQMGLIVLLESALAIFAGFILLAGAIMFVIRVVVLWLVIIFSPIAFLGMILPSMKEYSGKWWEYLIGQSFFAPAFLFMFMLVTKFINSDFVDSIFRASAAGTSDSMIVLGINGGTIALTFFHFFVVGGLMMACLIVARQLGGKTAEFGISWAHKGKDLALGGANALAFRPLARHTMGRGFDMMAKSDWAQKMAARFPIIGGGLYKTMQKGAGVGGYDKVMEDKIKLGKSLKTAELRAQYYDKVDARTQKEWYQKASARERVELHDKTSKKTQSELDQHFKTLSAEEQEKTIKARSEVDLKKTDDQLADIFLTRSEEIQKEIINQMKDGRRPGFVDKLNARRGTTPEFDTAIASTTPVGNNIRKFRPDLIDTSTLTGVAALEEAIKKQKPEDILLLNKDIANSPEVITEMVKSYKGGHVNKIIERGDELYTKFKDKLRDISGGSNRVSDVVSNLQRIGNPALASLIQSNEIMQKSLGLI